jgi:hypothetical protein
MFGTIDDGNDTEKRRERMADEARESVRLWKVGLRRGMAYVEGRDLAERVLSLSGGAAPVSGPPARRRASDQLLPGTMAVYSDRRGRAFAWQIAFDVRHWDAVASAAGFPSI